MRVLLVCSFYSLLPSPEPSQVIQKLVQWMVESGRAERLKAQVASPAFQTGSTPPRVRREGRALSPCVRATTLDSAWCPPQNGRGAENPHSPCTQLRGSASFSNVRNHTLAEPCLSALFWSHYLSTLMGKKDWSFANFLPSGLTKRNTAFSCSAASPSSFPLPNFKEFFWGDFGI